MLPSTHHPVLRRRATRSRLALELLSLAATTTLVPHAAHHRRRLSASSRTRFYLIRSAIGSDSLPISTADWLLWAAWLIAIVYFAALFYLPRSPTGIVLLPIVLGLMLSSHWASTEPLASEQSFYLLGMLHGFCCWPAPSPSASAFSPA